MPSTQPARGMRDFLPEDVRRRTYVVGVIREVYERYGFEPLETPAAENIETLLGKYGEEGNKLIFKILKRGEHEASGQADLALRYDLTVPLARVVAEYQAKLPKFFKRYQVQPVWRADRPARGRFREFYQCDIDAIGSKSTVIEAELCAAASDVLTRLGFNDFAIRLNHRGLLPALLRGFFDLPQSRHAEALVALDKLDKVGEEGVAAEMEDRGLLNRQAALEGLKRAANYQQTRPGALVSPALEGLQRAAELYGDYWNAFRSDFQQRDPNLDPTVIDQMNNIVQLCESTAASGRVCVDPFLARGLDYYTGAIMEINVPDLAGSLGGGGRYDNLIGMFLGRDIPACGFSLGLERILVVMGERNMFPADVQRAAADVMVALWSDQAAGETLRLASELRRAGIRADLYPEPGKIGKQFKYASERGVPFVAVLGDDEIAQGNVTIKDLRSGEQVTVNRGDAAAHITVHLKRQG